MDAQSTYLSTYKRIGFGNLRNIIRVYIRPSGGTIPSSLQENMKSPDLPKSLVRPLTELYKANLATCVLPRSGLMSRLPLYQRRVRMITPPLRHGSLSEA